MMVGEPVPSDKESCALREKTCKPPLEVLVSLESIVLVLIWFLE